MAYGSGGAPMPRRDEQLGECPDVRAGRRATDREILIEADAHAGRRAVRRGDAELPIGLELQPAVIVDARRMLSRETRDRVARARGAPPATRASPAVC